VMLLRVTTVNGDETHYLLANKHKKEFYGQLFSEVCRYVSFIDARTGDQIHITKDKIINIRLTPVLRS